ncbi:LOW QUALITY PROTEIN: E3 ubiquitin-protein ligase TRIM69 [Salvelinus alpinus]
MNRIVRVAVWLCLTSAYLCEAHALLHQQRAALRGHNLVEVTEDPLSLKGWKHFEQRWALKLFCMEERVPACSLCVLVGLKNHQAVQLQEAYPEHKNMLEANMSQLLKRRRVAKYAIKDLEDLDLLPIQEVERELCAPERMRTVERMIAYPWCIDYDCLSVDLRTLTLDSKTSHPKLEVSRDRLQVCWNTQPIGKDRYECYDSSVLAQESFSTGLHYWEVIVHEKPYWLIGAANGSIPSRDWRMDQTQDLTNLGLARGTRDLSASTMGMDSTGEGVQKLDLMADVHKGELLFYNADTLILLHRFSVQQCVGPYPMFNPCIDVNREPLTLFCLRDDSERSVSSTEAAQHPLALLNQPASCDSSYFASLHVSNETKSECSSQSA